MKELRKLGILWGDGGGLWLRGEGLMFGVKDVLVGRRRLSAFREVGCGVFQSLMLLLLLLLLLLFLEDKGRMEG